jgi:hypothetical protein
LGYLLKDLGGEGLKGGRGTMTKKSRPAAQKEPPPGWLICNGQNLTRQPLHQSLLSSDVPSLLGVAMLPLPTKLPFNIQIVSLISWIFKEGAILTSEQHKIPTTTTKNMDSKFTQYLYNKNKNRPMQTHCYLSPL